MKRKHTIVLASITAAALGVIAIACGPAASPGTGACNNQGNMSNAVIELREARAALERAEHDKGGWRAAAIQQTNDAIRETERGCAFANNH
jgi:hypothetical protein